MTFREPLGVVGLITPWNFPLAIASWKVAPALAAGNTVVLKPAELTPLTALELERIALEAGLPEGVLNVVSGPGPDRRASASSSTRTWRRSRSPARPRSAGASASSPSQSIKRVTLELGGKSANVVFADADLEAAAASAPLAVFGNAGQDCCARSRILVEESALDRFMEALEDAVKALRVGDPLDDSTRDGAAHLRRPAREGRLVRRGRRAGGHPRLGARRAGLLVPSDGSLPGLERRPRGARGDLRPGRVRDPVPRRGGRRAHRERHDLRPLRLDLDAGRRKGLARGARASRRERSRSTRTRRCASQTPFGGFKQSGMGRELGPHALDYYTELKNVFISTA